MDKEKLYNMLASEKSDIKRIDKIYNAYVKGKINKNNFYDVVRSFCKNVKSDHAIKSWQIIADYFYKNVLKGSV